MLASSVTRHWATNIQIFASQHFHPGCIQAWSWFNFKLSQRDLFIISKWASWNESENSLTFVPCLPSSKLTSEGTLTPWQIFLCLLLSSPSIWQGLSCKFVQGWPFLLKFQTNITGSVTGAQAETLPIMYTQHFKLGHRSTILHFNAELLHI